MDCMQLMDITTATTCFLPVLGCTAKPHQIGKGSRNMCGANHGTSWKHLKFGKVSRLVTSAMFVMVLLGTAYHIILL